MLFDMGGWRGRQTDRMMEWMEKMGGVTVGVDA